VRDLRDALELLPDNQRRAVLLREWQGLSYAEIADELHLSVPAVEALLFRARRALAAHLERTRSRLLNLGSSLATLRSLMQGGPAKMAVATAVAGIAAAPAVVDEQPDVASTDGKAPVRPTLAAAAHPSHSARTATSTRRKAQRKPKPRSTPTAGTSRTARKAAVRTVAPTGAPGAAEASTPPPGARSEAATPVSPPAVPAPQPATVPPPVQPVVDPVVEQVTSAVPAVVETVGTIAGTVTVPPPPPVPPLR
jgi:hypothetical protein